MKKILIIGWMATFTACSSSSSKQNQDAKPASGKTVYTCTMHPEVKADKPGTCPQCGMDLVEQ